MALTWGLLLAGLLVYEVQTSRFQSLILSRMARKLTYWMEPGPSDAIHFPLPGPYDQRLGYSRLPDFIDQLTTAKDYSIQAQARNSPELLKLEGKGLFPIYHEKTKTGLRILDRDNQPLFAVTFPERVYERFEDLPPAAVKTLLFIENREALDPRYPYRNPAVEWGRLTNAVLQMAIRMVSHSHKAPGGSTLATQIEKFRHSPGGLTLSVKDKFNQMASASLRAYLDGPQTTEARYRIALDYINSIPLAAAPGYGEVTGLGDGLWVWYGADFDQVNKLLRQHPTNSRDPNLAAWALAYKQVLGLFLSQRRPSFYLIEDRRALDELVRSYLPLLVQAGVLSPVEREAVAQARLELRRGSPPQPDVPFVERKAASAIRSRLAANLDISQLYELDRLDLTVSSTLDRRTQDEVTRMLTRLRDPAYAEQAGLRGFRLLEKGDPDKVIYSFTLFERGNRVNLMRVQADNFNQPLNINEGVKLELGSTAKLRTLITYLEIVAELHGRYAGQPPTKLRQVEAPPSDQISRWALNYLASSADTSLPAMLEAAMDRSYSASPAEQFFTGGGMHTFANFDPEKDDGGVFSVRHGLYRSVNLVFIRLMRSIVRYYMFQGGGSPDMFEDPDDPARQVYLEKFADREGKEFLNRFYKKYQEKKKGKEQVLAEPLERLLQDIHPTPARLAVIFRTVKPDADLDKFTTFMRSHLPNSVLPNSTLSDLYKSYSMDSYSLADRGYIARVHPLELWLVAYLQQHPQTKRSELMDASAAERQEVYNWLFKTHQKNSQDSRIRTLLEVEAFEQINRSWKRLGYPFESLVPSYATSIGVSGDRPAALAELMGILINDGVRYPSVRAQELHFAKDTPFETILQPEREGGEQVLRPEVARMARQAIIGVVEQGTARRVYGAFAFADSTLLPVGGKTGTGDNRHEIYGVGGKLIDSQITSRTATFMFLIGDRFFGTLTAYVAGKDAAGYKFTSSLPVQVLKVLAPKLMPLIERAYKEEPLQAHATPALPLPPAPVVPPDSL